MNIKRGVQPTCGSVTDLGKIKVLRRKVSEAGECNFCLNKTTWVLEITGRRLSVRMCNVCVGSINEVIE